MVDKRSQVTVSERLSVGGTYEIKRKVPGHFVARADVYTKRAEIDNFSILSNGILFTRPLQSTLSSLTYASKFVFDRLTEPAPRLSIKYPVYAY